VQVDAVGLGALQQGHVLEFGELGERLDEVPQHRQVGVHLVLLGPSGDEAGLLEDRRVDDVCDAGQALQRLAGRRLIAQVDRQMLEGPLVEHLGPAPGQRDDVPVVVEEPVDAGGADQPAGAGNEDGVDHGALLDGGGGVGGPCSS
jgi:hypothetical protein